MGTFDKIKRMAAKNNLSILKIEELAGLSYGSIYKWNKVSPTLKNAAKVAKVLKCKVGDLVADED